ncbi:MAG: hypothetical protein KF773_06860 [Deltaproteobacteria bacterium]|nr:hypothetical protein [Deltaproteobacteria bacterium]MCW5803875.1 hypothetical protein [Deltaproteobacteria bacterium]
MIDLAERAKELGCLISVSRVLADRNAPLPEILERVVHEIPQGWRYPDLAFVRLRWKDRQWAARDFRATPWTMVQAIGGGPEPIGSIELAYRECPHPEAEPPFLAEETRLLRAIAERVTDVIELKEAESAVGAHRDQLRSLASQLATTEERQRREIATHLHDRIGQDLALIKMRLENLRGRACDDAHNRVIDQVCELSADVLRKTRVLIFEISNPILHELGLVPAIEWLADTMRSQHGLAVDVLAEAIPQLEEDLTALVFRSANELLNNVVRHARARSAVVRVRVTGEWLRVEIEDDGRGFATEDAVQPGASPAFGLFSIRERLAHSGGRLELASVRDRGTRASIVAPLARRPS